MIYWFLFSLELFILFFTSRFIFRAIFAIFMKIFKKESIAIIPIFILFLPGVIIHELSHFLAAELLFVRVHDLEVAPRLEGGSLQMGSVKISETDIVRRMIIGVAPVILGSAFLLAVLFYFVNNISGGMGLLVVWIAFFITNTMFSSKKDVEGALELLLFILFLGLTLTIFTLILRIDFLRPSFAFLTIEPLIDKIKLITILFSIPVGINLVIYLFAKLILRKM